MQIEHRHAGIAEQYMIFTSFSSNSFLHVGMFSSDLEKMTLQLTSPNDTPLTANIINDLVHLLNAEIDDPECITSVIGKLSKKLHEPNVFSKVKVFASIHRLVQRTDEQVRHAIMQIIKGLQEVSDSKGSNFFAPELIESAKTSAGNVEEIQTADFLSVYSQYVLDLAEVRGRKSRIITPAATDALLGVLQCGELVNECYYECERPGKKVITYKFLHF